MMEFAEEQEIKAQQLPTNISLQYEQDTFLL